MQSKEHLEQMISIYQLTFPLEQHSLTDIINFLQTTEGTDLYSRTNFNGHITASAFVVDTSRNNMLLLHHRKLNRWLQPGGHVDASDASLLSAAIRETVEETGLTAADLQPVAVSGTESLLDIDSHGIPANINKNEPAHTHHDIRFLFTCSNKPAMQLNNHEAINFKWVPVEDLLKDETFSRVAQKIGLLHKVNTSDVIAEKLV